MNLNEIFTKAYNITHNLAQISLIVVAILASLYAALITKPLSAEWLAYFTFAFVCSCLYFLITISGKIDMKQGKP